MERTTTSTPMSTDWDNASKGTDFPPHLRQLEPILKAAKLLDDPDGFEIINGTLGLSAHPQTYTAISLPGGKTILSFNFKPEYVFVFPVNRSEAETDPALVAELQNMPPEGLRDQIVKMLTGHLTNGSKQPCTADHHPDFIKRGISVINVSHSGINWPVRLRDDLLDDINMPKAAPAFAELALS